MAQKSAVIALCGLGRLSTKLCTSYRVNCR